MSGVGWRDSDSGFSMELETVVLVLKFKRLNHKNESTEARRWGGATCVVLMTVRSWSEGVALGSLN